MFAANGSMSDGLAKRILTIIVLSLSAGCQPATHDEQWPLMKIEKDFAQAVLNNDVEAIGKVLADDWVIVNADGGVIDKARFLSVIKAGTLVHDEMELDDMRVRVYRDSAVVTTITTAKGNFMGEAFATRERAADFFIRQDGRWQCVFSQLTRFNKKEAAN